MNDVYVYDPSEPEMPQRLPSPLLSKPNTLKDLIKKVDVIVIAVPWKEFSELTAEDFNEAQIVIDPWRVLVHKKLPCKHYAYGMGWVT